MNSARIIFALVAIAGFASSSQAQESNGLIPIPGTSYSVHAKERAAIMEAEAVIKKMHSHWSAYLSERSVSEMRKLLEVYSDTIVSNSAGEITVGMEAFRNRWMEGHARMKSLPDNFSISGSSKILKSRVVSPSIVLVYTSEKVDFYSNGNKLNPREEVWTYVVAKQDNDWKIVSQTGSTKTDNQ